MNRVSFASCLAWLSVAALVSSTVGCAEPPAASEAKGRTRSKFELVLPRVAPRLGPMDGPPASGFGSGGAGRKVPLPGDVIPKATDPCDVARGSYRGDGCGGNPGDTYNARIPCEDGEAGCVGGVRPGFMNNTTDPKAPADGYDPNLAQADEPPATVQRASYEGDAPAYGDDPPAYGGGGDDDSGGGGGDDCCTDA